MSYVSGPVQRRRAESAPPPWSPSDLTGLHWALSIDGTSQWIDTAQSGPANTNGALIRRLIGQWGTGIIFDAPSDSASPIYSTAGFPDGLPCGELDGGNDAWIANDAGLTGTQSFGVRCSYVGGTYNKFIFSSRNSSNTGAHVRVMTATTLRFQVGVGTSSVATLEATLPSSIGTGAHTLILTWDGVSVTAGSSYVVEWDGSVLSLTEGTAALNISAITASRTHLGQWGGGTSQFPGKIRKAIRGTGAWDAPTRAQVRTWLEAA